MAWKQFASVVKWILLEWASCLSSVQSNCWQEAFVNLVLLHPVWTSLLTMILLGSQPRDAHLGVTETAHAFKITIMAKSTMNNEGKKQSLDTWTEIRYTWKRKGRERTLFQDELKLQIKINGEEFVNSSISRDRAVFREKGKDDVDFLFENAPEALKKTLQDSFGAPLCRLEVDEYGKEIKRTILAGPGAKDAVQNGIIANALLFHPPFFPDKDNWVAEREVSIGRGGSVKGNISYKKVPGEKGKRTVKVSGTLKNEGFRPPGAPATARNIHKVSGEQTFDLGEKEWVAGKLTMAVSIEFTADGKPIGSGQSTMTVTFEKLPAK
jgi:hypothetical protein